MIKRLLFTILFSLIAVPAFAACTPGFIATPGSGSNQTFSTKAAADTNCESLFDIDTSSQMHTDLTASLPAGTAQFGSLVASTPATPIAVLATDNHAVLKNGAGVAMSVHTSNNSATKNYLRLYDAGTGFNGCNSATGVIFAMEIPPNDSGFTVSLGGGNGITFSNGLSWCITSGFGLTDTTAATASAIYANASYR